jgi:hypothetical protein
MKSFLLLVVVFGLAGAVLFVPVAGRSFWARAQERGIPAAIARGTAHGLRAAWDSLAALGQHEPAPAHPPRHLSRKAQAAAQPIHRAGREGILAQPPKEKLQPADRAALNSLIAHAH